jgi:hypothetical protein
MRKFFCLAMILSLALGVVAAQSSGLVSKPGAAPAKPAASAPSTTADELIALLPPSDGIAILDVNRIFNELLPKLAELSTGGVDKLAQKLSTLKEKTGVDPTKIQAAVLGARMSSLNAPGVVILQGIDLDAKQIEALAAEYKAEYKVSEYKGKTIYNVITKKPAPSAGPVSLKTDELAVVSLGNQRTALGDLTMLKATIDGPVSGGGPGVGPELTKALGETRGSSLLRFAVNPPESMRSQLTDQGDLFKSIATIKMILGSFDAANDLSLSLDALMRTASQNEATELETSLKGLLMLVKGIFGGGDAKTDVIGQLLDQIKIGSKMSDVSLSIAVPRSLLDQLSKKATPAEKKNVP